MTTLETIVKEGQSTFIEDRTDTFLVLFAQHVIAGVRENVVPEEGIKWMQEGSNKNRKGFTDGFNESRVEILRRLAQFSGEGTKT